MSDIIIIPQIKESEQDDHFIELDCQNPEDSIVQILPIKECRRHEVTVNVEDLKKLVEAAKQDIGGQLTSLATKKEVQDLSNRIPDDVASKQYVQSRERAIESVINNKEDSIKSFILSQDYATNAYVIEKVNSIPKYEAGDNVVIKDDVISAIIPDDVASKEYVQSREHALESQVDQKNEAIKSFVLEQNYATQIEVDEKIQAIPKYTAGNNIIIDGYTISSLIPNTVASKEYVQSRESVIESQVDQKDEAVKSFVLEYVDGKGFLVASDIENKLDQQVFLNFSDELSSSIQEISQRQVELEKLTTTPVVDCTNIQDSSYTLSPNKKYIFGTKSTLAITLEQPTDTTIVNHYYFEFTSGNTATNLSLPASIKWTSDPSIKSNKIYQISIENNLGVIQEWG